MSSSSGRASPPSCDFEDFFENGAVGLHIVGADGIVLRANKAELNLLGYEEEEYVGRHITEFHVDQPVIDDILCRLSRGEKIERYPARLRAKDGSFKHVQITSSAKITDQGFLHTRCFTVDVTDAMRAEERTRDWHRQLLDALPAAVYTTDKAGTITYYNQAAADLAGRRPVVGLDQWCVSWRLYRSDGTPLPHEECPMAIALKEQRPIRGAEAILARPDGTRATFVPHPTPLRDPDTNEMVGAVNMLIDISERKRAEETERLLAKELNHRIKNTLSNVQAMARYTLRHSKSSAHFVESFSARLQSLARVHGLLTENSWSGAELSHLAREQLFSSGSGENRIRLAGPAVKLEADMALHFALILHELATNSHKYGALSIPNGRVTLSWEIKDWTLSLKWSEKSDRVVVAPIRRGFGTTLIEESLKPHGGSSHLSYETDGLTWSLSVPLPDTRRVEPQEANPTFDVRSSESTSFTNSGSASGKRVLVVEDEPLIALDQVANLEDIGAHVVGPCGTIAEALNAIRTTSIDVGLLDANLGGKAVNEIAAELTQQNIPFAFVTGYGRESLPRSFQTAPLLRKPCTREALQAMVEQLTTPDRAVISIRDRTHA